MSATKNEYGYVPKPVKDTWGLLELMGHQRIAGKLSEENFGGTFIRVDVPEVNDTPAYTKLFGQSAIYAVTFTSEEVARKLAERLRIVPVQPYEIESRNPSYQPDPDADDKTFG